MKGNLNKCVLLILFIICALSCSEQIDYHSYLLPSSDKLLDLDSTRFKVDYSIIMLQDGGGDTLLENVSKIVAAGEKLYILSNGSVYIFNADGSFLKSYSKGEDLKSL